MLYIATRNGIKCTAELDGNYRYSLTRTWGTGRALIVIGTNPSKATHEIDDATIRVLMGYGREKLKCGELLMLNMFGWRATSPAELKRATNSGIHTIGELNHFEHLKLRILEKPEDSVVIAAWGTPGMERGFDFCRYMGRQFCEQRLKAIAVNKDGSPHHPLRVSLTGNLHPYPGEDAFWVSPLRQLDRPAAQAVTSPSERK